MEITFQVDEIGARVERWDSRRYIFKVANGFRFRTKICKL